MCSPRYLLVVNLSRVTDVIIQVDFLTLVDHVQVASRLWRRWKVPNVMNRLLLDVLINTFGRRFLLVM